MLHKWHGVVRAKNLLKCIMCNYLTLRCKAIRGRILGVGAAWLGLGGVWLLGNHIQPNQKPIRMPASPGTKQRAMQRIVSNYLSDGCILFVVCKMNSKKFGHSFRKSP